MSAVPDFDNDQICNSETAYKVGRRRVECCRFMIVSTPGATSKTNVKEHTNHVDLSIEAVTRAESPCHEVKGVKGKGRIIRMGKARPINADMVRRNI